MATHLVSRSQISTPALVVRTFGTKPEPERLPRTRGGLVAPLFDPPGDDVPRPHARLASDRPSASHKQAPFLGPISNTPCQFRPGTKRSGSKGNALCAIPPVANLTRTPGRLCDAGGVRLSVTPVRPLRPFLLLPQQSPGLSWFPAIARLTLPMRPNRQQRVKQSTTDWPGSVVLPSQHTNE